MSISRGRLPPGVLSVFFDAVSATPPILPRTTDTRLPPRRRRGRGARPHPVSARDPRRRGRRAPRDPLRNAPARHSSHPRGTPCEDAPRHAL
ncbi:hypothetical protein GCM10009564_03780 [Streptomyces thermogriseus]|uniref:Uncharacterized protein n=1 Tax=Streptomyces thermogriseus TaxID=75292 RepID=A0ABN1SS12_9ACTN